MTLGSGQPSNISLSTLTLLHSHSSSGFKRRFHMQCSESLTAALLASTSSYMSSRSWYLCVVVVRFGEVVRFREVVVDGEAVVVVWLFEKVVAVVVWEGFVVAVERL